MKFGLLISQSSPILQCMQISLKRNAVLVSGLAIFFWWSFEFAKHDPSLRSIIPFGDDPYDAVSSFGVITATLLALVSLTRAFFPQGVGRSGRPIYVLRAQLAVPFCILVTLAAQGIALLRHTTLWVGALGSRRLLVLVATQAVLSLLTLSILMNNVEVREWRLFARPAVLWLGTTVALALYPERLILETPGHLFTVVFGAVCLFVPVSALIQAALPAKSEMASYGRVRGKSRLRYLPLAIAAGIGLLVGIGAYVSELTEGGPRPAVTQILFVSSVYMALGASGLLIGYLCLGRLLGFTISDPNLQQP